MMAVRKMMKKKVIDLKDVMSSCIEDTTLHWLRLAKYGGQTNIQLGYLQKKRKKFGLV